MQFNHLYVGNLSTRYLEDIDELDRLRKELDDDKALIEIFYLFTKIAQRHIQKIINFSAIEGWKELQKEAHSLKSSSANLRAFKVSEICAQLEKCHEKPYAELLIKKLQLNFEEFHHHLSLFREEKNLY